MGFTRRYTSDPGLATILEIEGVVVIDNTPPSNLTGDGLRPVCMIGEFEDGPFTPIEVSSGTDFLNMFGGFGFTYDGVTAQNPCARARYADGVANPEYWNGNGFIALAQKTFSQLFLVRVDTSVGAMSFTRQPEITGNQDFSWALNNGDSIDLQLDDTSESATFTGAVAVITSAASTYPTTFVGGESMNVTIDANTPQQIGPLDIIFQSGDQSRDQVLARINTALGYTAAATVSSAQLSLSGRLLGKQGSVQVNSVSSGLVTTATGFSAGAPTLGTGNVNNLAQVTFLEVKSIVEAGATGTRVEQDDAGHIRIVATTAQRILFDNVNSTQAFGFGTAGFTGTVARVNGLADLISTGGTYPTTFAGGESLTLGFDTGPNVAVVFQSGDQTEDQVIARINTTFGETVASAFDATHLQLTSPTDGGQVRVVSASSGVFTALGLTAQSIIGVESDDVPIPAGYRVRDSAGHEWVTMQTTVAAAGVTTPYSIKVRPGLDNDSLPSASANAVNVIVDVIPGLALSATNPLGLAAALSEPAIDAAYQVAMAQTLSLSAVTKLTDMIVSARQSNAIRGALRINAITASGATIGGLNGRRAVVSPPLGTTRAQANSDGVQPGVGTYRSERLWYGFPGVTINVPQIAAVGTAGGAGFTADGNIDVHYDSWISSTASQLPPEQNPGQETSTQDAVIGIESGNPDVQNMTMQDYIQFKASGIMAPLLQDGTCVIESGVTSVDPAQQPSLAPASRGAFSDWLSDTLAAGAQQYAKKPMTRGRRLEVFGMVTGLLEQLKSPTDPDSSRIFDYSVDAKKANTPTTTAAGVFRLKIAVQMNPDMLDIVFDMTVGTTVTVVQTQ